MRLRCRECGYECEEFPRWHSVKKECRNIRAGLLSIFHVWEPATDSPEPPDEEEAPEEEPEPREDTMATDPIPGVREHIIKVIADAPDDHPTGKILHRKLKSKYPRLERLTPRQFHAKYYLPALNKYRRSNGDPPPEPPKPPPTRKKDYTPHKPVPPPPDVRRIVEEEILATVGPLPTREEVRGILIAFAEQLEQAHTAGQPITFLRLVKDVDTYTDMLYELFAPGAVGQNRPEGKEAE